MSKYFCCNCGVKIRMYVSDIFLKDESAACINHRIINALTVSFKPQSLLLFSHLLCFFSDALADPDFLKLYKYLSQLLF